MKVMNEIPIEVRARICNLLEQEDLESVHMGYGSTLDCDNRSFAVIARDRSADPSYMVYVYDSKDDELQCYDDTLTYPEALISMGEYIKE